VAQEAASEVRQLDAARQPLEKGHAELLLEEPDALRQRRLRDAELAGRGRDAPVPGDLREVLELAKVHRSRGKLLSLLRS